MNTANLIAAIAEDGVTRSLSPPSRMAAALAIGIAVAAAMFMHTLGMRPDIAMALHTWRFVAKVAIALSCFGFALWACSRLVRPDAPVGKIAAGLAVAPALLAVAVGWELMMVPSDQWYARAIGNNSRVCLAAVPLLAIAPLVALLIAVRAGAPRSPSMAGTAVGLLAGGLAASLYAMHCPDDSPLFVALWYTPAILLVVLVGAVAGRRVLRW